MNTQSDHKTTLTLSFPFGAEQVFRYRAMEDILKLLVRNPFRAFTVRRLRELTDSGMKSTSRAVELLTQLGLVCVDTTGRSKDVSLNRDRVHVPDDPLFAVPQDEFRPPIREFVARAREEVPALSAVVVFGSVARGAGDRQSDIDVWLLVTDDDRLLGARRQATSVATDLGDERFVSPQRTADAPIEGDRYEFQVLVESVDTALSHGEELVEILREGIVVVDSDPLQRVKDVVLHGRGEPADE